MPNPFVMQQGDMPLPGAMAPATTPMAAPPANPMMPGSPAAAPVAAPNLSPLPGSPSSDPIQDAAQQGQGGGGGGSPWYNYLPQGGLLGVIGNIGRQSDISAFRNDLMSGLKAGQNGQQAFLSAIMKNPNIMSSPEALQGAEALVAATLKPALQHSLINGKEVFYDPQGNIKQTISSPEVKDDNGFFTQVDSPINDTLSGKPKQNAVVTSLGRFGPKDDFHVISTNAGSELVATDKDSGESRVVMKLGADLRTADERNLDRLIRVQHVDPNLAIDTVFHTNHITADPVSGDIHVFSDRTGSDKIMDDGTANLVQFFDQKQYGGKSANLPPNGTAASPPQSGDTGTLTGGPGAGPRAGNASTAGFEPRPVGAGGHPLPNAPIPTHLGEMSLEDLAKYGTGFEAGAKGLIGPEVAYASGAVMAPQMEARKNLLEQFNLQAREFLSKTNRFTVQEQKYISDLLPETGFFEQAPDMALHINQLRGTLQQWIQNYVQAAQTSGTPKQTKIELRDRAFGAAQLLQSMGPAPQDQWWLDTPAAVGSSQLPSQGRFGGGQVGAATLQQRGGVSVGGYGTPGSSPQNPLGVTTPQQAAKLPHGTYYTRTDGQIGLHQ